MRFFTKTSRLYIKILYLLGLLSMIIILCIIMVGKTSCTPDYLTEDYSDITNDWALDNSLLQPIDLQQLGNNIDKQSGTLSIFYHLPAMTMDQSLVYRSKDVCTRILINGTLIYETNVPDSPLYNRSPGNLWNVVTISSDYSDAYLEMQIKMVYDPNAVTIDHTYFGDKTHIILGFVNKKIIAVIISIITLLLGIIFFVLDFLPAYKPAQNQHGLCYLGIFAILIGIWSLIETNILQFFVYDVRILQLIDNMVMILDSIPLFLYIDAEYQVLDYAFMRCICCLDCIFILICAVTQCTGIADMHYFIQGATLAQFLFSAVLIFFVLRTMIHSYKNKDFSIQTILRLIGICFIWICGLFATTKYTNADGMDRAESIRFGMLLFILCFGISSQLEAYKLIRQGMKYDILNNLAYSDALTGLSNRTAYLEQLEHYAQSNLTELGIVFLDINNLKQINDNKGHEQGDHLIKLAANIIQSSFGLQGNVYRIGGDEFCVFFDHANVKKLYENTLPLFYKEIKNANISNPYNLHIQIAHGFSICTNLNPDTMEKAIANADSAMYDNKMKLKMENS